MARALLVDVYEGPVGTLTSLPPGWRSADPGLLHCTHDCRV